MTVGVIAAALSACGPEADETAAGTAGVVAATATATGTGNSPSAAASSPAVASPSAPTQAGTTASAAPSPAASTATAGAPTAGASTAPAAPATRAPSSPAAAKAPSKPPTGAAPSPATKAPTAGTARPDTTAPPRTVPTPDTSASDYSAGSAEALSLRLINEERARNGVPALVVKADLTDFAVKWAQHMRETGFAHSANASGAGPSLTGSRTLTGECIVMWSDASLTGQQAAEQFQKMWTESPGHHAAQINPKYKEIGVGLYHDSTGWWGVHEFAG
ncbi:hypothetical protein C2142_37315 [Streptomyces sp. CB01881]|nr:hypothetical protein C2142_37315 [Streptomyces sp. CB01881]